MRRMQFAGQLHGIGYDALLYMPPRKRPADTAPEQNATLEHAVVDLTAEVRTLSQHVEVLIAAVDDARQEIETALRHLPREPWTPTQLITSMPRNPLVEDFVVNRTKKDDLPTDSTKATAAAAVAKQKDPPSDSQSKPRPNKTPVEDVNGTRPRSKPASKKQKRLDLKLYFETAYSDLVRFIGYSGKPLKDVQSFVQKLEKQHGRDKVKEAGDAIAVIEGRGEPYTVRLKDEVRRLAVQMLGPPPETRVPAERNA